MLKCPNGNATEPTGNEGAEQLFQCRKSASALLPRDIGTPVNGRLRNGLAFNVLQNAVFRIAEHGILACNSRPFRRRKTAFRRAEDRRLLLSFVLLLFTVLPFYFFTFLLLHPFQRVRLARLGVDVILVDGFQDGPFGAFQLVRHEGLLHFHRRVERVGACSLCLAQALALERNV